MPNVKERIAAHRADSREAQQRLAEATRISEKVDALNRELSQLEARRDKFLAVGDRRLEQAFQSYFEGLGIVQMEPVRSALTGNELAAKMERNIADVLAQLAPLEAEIAELLEGADAA
jgi:hypothetical protein